MRKLKQEIEVEIEFKIEIENSEMLPTGNAVYMESLH